MAKKKNVVKDMTDVMTTGIMYGVATGVTQASIPATTPMAGATRLAVQGTLTTMTVKDLSKKMKL